MTCPPGNSSIHQCHRRGNKAGSGGPHAGFSRALLWRSGTPSSLCSLHMGSEGPSFAHEDAALMILTGEAEVPCRGYEQEAISALSAYKPCNPHSILKVSTVPRQPPRLPRRTWGNWNTAVCGHLSEVTGVLRERTEFQTQAGSPEVCAPAPGSTTQQSEKPGHAELCFHL